MNNSHNSNPFRIAIIGSGPSGFYAADALLNTQVPVEVDIFDRLPTPFGLVRYGVAPDHPKIKNVIKIYEKTATDPRVTFFGHVNIGHDITLAQLRLFYDAVIFASGAQTDKPLGIPNEHFQGSHTATEFVSWYNGHPDYQDRVFDLSHPVAVVVGLGNVAMDVARILSKTVDELRNTDITKRALEVLAESKVKEVRVIGRRGPVQAAFTPAEIKEFGELAMSEPQVDPGELILNEASQKELDDPKVPVRRKNFEVLQKYSQTTAGQKPKRVVFQFLRSPVEIVGNGRVERLILEKNTLFGEPGKQNAKGTGEREELVCGNIFRSVGYHGVAIADVPFDEKRGVIPNQAGRVIMGGKPVAGLYATGWIKRGPSGIIGTNKADSDETVKNLIADSALLPKAQYRERAQIQNFLQDNKIRYITYPDWQKIDAAEVAAGAAVSKPREKFTSVDEMLVIVKK